MGNRRKSREYALQALFYMDAQRCASPEMIDSYCQCFLEGKRKPAFFETLVTGVLEAKAELDATIEQYSDNWRLSRMAGVDRNILRIAVYELLYCEDIPVKVSINEAIDIGKKFGTDESGSFINGILDSIRKTRSLPKKPPPARTTPPVVSNKA